MAYTKYSLTPANNTAAPPDGAPEGMLPSAVNDTMRDMMAQIRDCGDGVRDGTYTMTAPKITGGTITGVTLTGNTFSSPVITGGTINNATIGATTATTGKFTTLTNSALTSGRVTYAGASGLLADSAAFTFDGSNIVVNSTTPAYFTGTSNLAQISINRSPSTGTIFNASQSAAFINIDGVSGGSSIQFATATANNTQPGERARIDSSGNLGLGVTPSAWGTVGYIAMQFPSGGSLSGYKPNNAPIIHLSSNLYYDDTNDRYVINGAATRYSQNQGVHSWSRAASGTAGNVISFTQAMTLNASGSFFIGCTSAPSASVFGTAFIYDGTNGYWNNSGSSTGATTHFQFINPNGVVGTISTSGSATSYNTSSDQRLKTNIVDAPSGNIDDIKVRSFDWIADDSHQEYGMVAQELIEVAPYAVSKPKNPDEMMGIDYSKLVPMMIKEIQDLKQRIATLENK